MYIIDNSPDDTIRQWYNDPRVEYIYNNANIGFGAAHNIIMRDISKLGKYHLVLNPDIRFENGVLEKLYHFMEENPNIGNCMPRIVYPDGNLQYLCKLLPTPRDWIIRCFSRLIKFGLGLITFLKCDLRDTIISWMSLIYLVVLCFYDER